MREISKRVNAFQVASGALGNFSGFSKGSFSSGKMISERLRGGSKSFSVFHVVSGGFKGLLKGSGEVNGDLSNLLMTLKILLHVVYN